MPTQTERQFAKHIRVSHTAVQKAIAEGRITPEPDGRIDPEKAAAEWARNSRVRAKRSSSSEPQPGAPDYQESRARREAAEAALAELKLAEEEGSLVRLDEVRSALAARVSGVRDALRQIPARVAPELVAADTQEACFAIVEREIDQALLSLTDTL